MLHGVVGEAQLYAAELSARRELPQKYAADGFHLLLAQLAEHYHIVYSVDKLRAEPLFQLR